MVGSRRFEDNGSTLTLQIAKFPSFLKWAEEGKKVLSINSSILASIKRVLIKNLYSSCANTHTAAERRDDKSWFAFIWRGTVKSSQTANVKKCFESLERKRAYWKCLSGPFSCCLLAPFIIHVLIQLTFYNTKYDILHLLHVQLLCH